MALIWLLCVHFPFAHDATMQQRSGQRTDPHGLRPVATKPVACQPHLLFIGNQESADTGLGSSIDHTSQENINQRTSWESGAGLQAPSTTSIPSAAAVTPPSVTVATAAAAAAGNPSPVGSALRERHPSGSKVGRGGKRQYSGAHYVTTVFGPECELITEVPDSEATTNSNGNRNGSAASKRRSFAEGETKLNVYSQCRNPDRRSSGVER